MKNLKNQTAPQRIIGIAFIVSIITFIVYLPALENGFVNWDDDLYVYKNPNIHSINLFFAKWVFTSEVVGHWHPLTMFSYALDYAIWELNPFGYHLSNNILHSLNTALVFILVIRLMGFSSSKENLSQKSILTGVVTALLFGIHPMHVESVAWISERKDVLCAFFYLLTILAYLKYISKGAQKNVYYFACLTSFMLALLSKPMAVSLPIVLIILDFYPLERFKTLKWSKSLREVLVEKIPFFILSFLSSLITIWAQHSGALLQNLEAFPLTVRVFVAARAYVFYLAKMICPIQLSTLYPHPMRINFLSIEYLGSMVLFLIFIFLCIRSIRSNKMIAALCFYYLITLIPVIGILQVGAQSAADRYTYLPSLAPFLFAGLCVNSIKERYFNKKYKIIGLTGILILFVLLIFKTNNQINQWSDPIKFWTTQLKYTSGTNQEYKGYFSRGNAYIEIENYDQAIKDYARVIKLYPNYVSAYNNRGKAYFDSGNFRQAIKDYSSIIQLNPQNKGIYQVRGKVYQMMGNFQRAIADYNKSIEIDSRNGETYYNRALCHFNMRSYRKAIRDYTKSIQLECNVAKAYSNRGTAYGSLGKYREAINDFQKAVDLESEDAKTHYNLGVIYSKLGDIEKARIHFEKAADLGLTQAVLQLKRIIP